MASDEESTATDAPNGETDGSPAWYEWRQVGRPSTALVEAVAAETDREPTALVPLHHHVDADALDALVTGAATGTGRGVRVSFAYNGVEVVVDSDAGIQVRSGAGSSER